MTTTRRILRDAYRAEEMSPGTLAHVLLMETAEDYGRRDVLDQVARLVEIFGVAMVARGVSSRVGPADASTEEKPQPASCLQEASAGPLPRWHGGDYAPRRGCGGNSAVSACRGSCIAETGRFAAS